MWHTYILQCADGSLYTGVTTDLDRRIDEHNHSAKGAKYTRARRPVLLVYSEACQTRSAACSREFKIKQLTKKQKLELIDQTFTL
uniref:Endonuclease n=1 Tax=uncultured Thiotrichaceae bacterium TaxID=298394 RepID=A0A6S6SF48_9GAMM|nr:MAG: Endonuclease [uncultured Thiotrichaceae bacterium]